jgi:hypothetical protein
MDDMPRTGKFSDNSRLCVRLINDYWLARGYHMRARVELRPTIHKVNGQELTYWHNEIVSESLNGMPKMKIQ